MAEFWEEAAKRLENTAADPDSQWTAACRHWREIARPTQIPDPKAAIWCFQGGRGAGKTRSAMEAVSAHCLATPKARVALVARSFGDARDTLVEGESGLLNILPPSAVVGWNRSMGELRLIGDRLLTVYSDTEADRLRGPAFTYAVCDELAAWDGREAFDNLLLACRLGKFPQILITTTPRPTLLFRELVADPRVVVVRDSTFSNIANLAPSFRDSILARFAGTTIGRQEIEAELLLDVEGALWKLEELDAHRVERAPEDLRQVVVGVDPAGSSKAGADETGIVVCARATDGDGYVLADWSGRFTPDEWARRAVAAYEEFKADAIVVEKNFGGEMVLATIRTVDAKVPIRMVSATRGKIIRAQPIAALYQQGRVHHVGRLSDLESQQCSWTEDSRDSPDRLDALCWGMSEVMQRLASGPATVATWSGALDPTGVTTAVRGNWQSQSGRANQRLFQPDPAWGRGSLFSHAEDVDGIPHYERSHPPNRAGEEGT